MRGCRDCHWIHVSAKCCGRAASAGLQILSCLTQQKSEILQAWRQHVKGLDKEFGLPTIYFSLSNT